MLKIKKKGKEYILTRCPICKGSGEVCIKESEEEPSFKDSFQLAEENHKPHAHETCKCCSGLFWVFVSIEMFTTLHIGDEDDESAEKPPESK